jgi:hypothetical protein
VSASRCWSVVGRGCSGRSSQRWRVVLGECLAEGVFEVGDVGHCGVQRLEMGQSLAAHRLFHQGQLGELLAAQASLCGSKSRPAPLTWVIGVLCRLGLIVCCVVAAALSDLRPVARFGWHCSVARRHPRMSSCLSCAMRSLCCAGLIRSRAWIGGSSGVCRVDPIAAQGAA